MTRQFKPLTHHAVSNNAKVERRAAARAVNIALTDEAISVMTDLTKGPSFAIEATAPITKANDNMIACGVRLLFVTEDNGDLVGIITASDLLGEKPVQYISEHGGSREDIIVNDIMTKRASLEALRIEEVAGATVGDIIETLKSRKRQHLLVTQLDAESGVETVCGIYSSTQIGRQLGMVIEPSPRADSFAELEQALLLRKAG